MRPHRAWITAAGLALALGLLSRAPGVAAAPATTSAADPAVKPAVEKEAKFLSKTYVVDRKYKSMLGPQSTQVIHLEDSPATELLWVTGFKAVMVGPDGETPASQEFMCHSNLDLNMTQHRRIFDITRESPNRMFTLSQGQQEIRFPDGFGVPILSSEPFMLTTQVLNHNVEGQTFEIRHKVTVDFVRDRDLKAPMKPLFQVSANGLVLIEGKDGHFNLPPGDDKAHGPGCLPGTGANDKSRVFTDDFGRKFAGHWLVKPGREVNHTNTTKFMRLPYDTTLHYIAVHMHPFAESLELRDLTTDKSLYFSKVEPTHGKIGIDHVDHFSSAEGIPLYKDHEYELVSVYNNTTNADQDSMAVMYMYVLDKEFRPPHL
ncbi:MAG: hypothetical protein HY049_16495 [Acidobacteria bacterium]|nr:hypothetical protein [Acidobacteriota bacterium]